MLADILDEFEDLFDTILVEWDTETVDLGLNSYSKPFISRYYLVTRINKETFSKELQRLI